MAVRSDGWREARLPEWPAETRSQRSERRAWELLKNDVAAARTAHTITKGFQQVACFLAIAGGHHNFAIFACHGLQFARLREVANHEPKELSLLQRFVAGGFVAVGDDIAGESRQQFVGREIGSEGGHARERGQRTGNIDKRFRRLVWTRRRFGKIAATGGLVLREIGS